MYHSVFSFLFSCLSRTTFTITIVQSRQCRLHYHRLFHQYALRCIFYKIGSILMLFFRHLSKVGTSRDQILSLQYRLHYYSVCSLHCRAFLKKLVCLWCIFLSNQASVISGYSYNGFLTRPCIFSKLRVLPNSLASMFKRLSIFSLVFLLDEVPINMQRSAVCLMKWGALDESVFDELVMY